MLFRLVTTEAAVRQAVSPGVYLLHDNWNDWFKFKTMYTLYVVTGPGKHVIAGSVKIGQKGMTDQTETPALDETFEALDERFFSIGQDEDYYQAINEAHDFREFIYRGLRDCAYDQNIFFDNQEEYVMGESLLRSLSVTSVTGRLNRLAHGNAKLTHYRFLYSLPFVGEAGPIELSFEVNPESSPPTNVHVLIGRNGVGKTRCLSGMIGAILEQDAPDGNTPGAFRQESAEDTASVANLISVSFSAFDAADALPKNTVGRNRVLYSYIGLKHQPPNTAQSGDITEETQSPVVNLPKDTAALATEFANSMMKCQEGLRKDRWKRALGTLETDPLFKEAEVASLAATDLEGDWRARAIKRFELLSSGHAIVLLTITRLVELVEERSLVLIDEPEGHLHPPLLSAFVRALSDLLVQRNGVAIVATHSPVVLQEVPRSCVWLLSRSGAVPRVDRPQLETFGENVGVLTREVFGLEVTHSGFHALIDKAIDANEGNYEAVLQFFDNQLGAEGRAIARGLCVSWSPDPSEAFGLDEDE
jgi:hypothetical protein